MSTTLKRIEECLKESDLIYVAHPEDDIVRVGFHSDPHETTYRDKNGKPTIEIVIRLLERGEFLALHAPECWNISRCLDKSRVLEELINIQSRFKMIRFDTNGEIVVPNVEIPLEDNDITTKQLDRAIGAILQVVRQYDQTISDTIREEEIKRLSRDAGGPKGLRRLLGEE